MLGLQNEREWVGLLRDGAARPALAADPRFTGNARRVAERDVAAPRSSSKSSPG